MFLKLYNPECWCGTDGLDMLYVYRPGRLTDGPYTSYDLNTLLKATAGTRRDVIVGQGSVHINFLISHYSSVNFFLQAVGFE